MKQYEGQPNAKIRCFIARIAVLVELIVPIQS